jgi:hypothetical protein
VAVGVAIVIVGSVYSGPGIPQLTGGSTARIFDEPFTSGLRNAHVTIKADYGTGVETSQGVLQFRPTRAMELTTQSTGGIASRTIDIDGVGYNLGNDAKQWTATAGESSMLWYTGWDWPQVPYPLQVAGQGRVDGDLAWHLVSRGSDGNQTDWWIREKDGYPLKITVRLGDQFFSYAFSQFNSPSAPVEAPPEAQVSTSRVTGRVRDLIRVPWAQVQVTAVNQTYTGSGAPPPGYRFVAVRVMLKNTFARGWTLVGGPGLTDAAGLSLNTVEGPGPALPDPLNLAPGQDAQGWLTFQVPTHDEGLTLLIAPPQNSVGEPLVDDLISIQLP